MKVVRDQKRANGQGHHNMQCGPMQAICWSHVGRGCVGWHRCDRVSVKLVKLQRLGLDGSYV